MPAQLPLTIGMDAAGRSVNAAADDDDDEIEVASVVKHEIAEISHSVSPPVGIAHEELPLGDSEEIGMGRPIERKLEQDGTALTTKTLSFVNEGDEIALRILSPKDASTPTEPVIIREVFHLIEGPNAKTPYLGEEDVRIMLNEAEATCSWVCVEPTYQEPKVGLYLVRAFYESPTAWTTLVLWNIGMDDDMFEDRFIPAVIKSAASLRVLALGEDKVSSVCLLRGCCRVLPACQALVELALGDRELTEEDRICLFRALPKCPRLESLSMRSTTTSETALRELLKSMYSHPNLQSIQLKCKVSSIVYGNIEQERIFNTKLQQQGSDGKVELKHTLLSDSQWTKICGRYSALQQGPGVVGSPVMPLTVLDVTGCTLGDERLRDYIFPILKAQARSLMEVNLIENRLSSAVVAELVSILEDMPSLRVLQLLGNNFNRHIGDEEETHKLLVNLLRKQWSIVYVSGVYDPESKLEKYTEFNRRLASGTARDITLSVSEDLPLHASKTHFPFNGTFKSSSTLDLSFYELLGSTEEVEKLAAAVSFYTHLTALNMSHCRMSSQCATIALHAIAQHPKLIDVAFSSNNFGPNAEKLLAELLAGLHGLASLTLNDAGISDQVLSENEDSLMCHPKLEMLCLCSNGITSEGSEVIAAAIQGGANWRRLNLSSNPIKDAGFGEIIKELRTGNTNLEELIVRRCSLTSKSIEALIEGISRGLAVKTVRLDYNNISESGALLLAQYMSSSAVTDVAKPITIALAGNILGTTGIAALHKAMKESGRALQIIGLESALER